MVDFLRPRNPHYPYDKTKITQEPEEYFWDLIKVMNHVYQDVWRAFKRVERSLDVIMDLDSNTFTPPRTTNANEPTLDTGEMQIWHDANSNTVYLVYNDANGGQVKTSLS